MSSFLVLPSLVFLQPALRREYTRLGGQWPEVFVPKRLVPGANRNARETERLGEEIGLFLRHGSGQQLSLDNQRSRTHVHHISPYLPLFICTSVRIAAWIYSGSSGQRS
jgi:hypothetical protein